MGPVRAPKPCGAQTSARPYMRVLEGMHGGIKGGPDGTCACPHGRVGHERPRPPCVRP
jgi:hypothetical protein